MVFPHNIGLGATRNPALVEEVARITAEEVRATGIQWTFAPCVAVARDERWGRTYESYAEDPELVAELGAAAVRGLQGPTSGIRCACSPAPSTTSVTAAPPGARACTREGARGAPWTRATRGSSEAELRRLHMPGYLDGHRGRRGHDHAVLQQLERREGSREASACSPTSSRTSSASRASSSPTTTRSTSFPATTARQSRSRSTRAWTWSWCRSKYREFFTTLKELVETGEVPMARIDDAVLRILRVKFAMGLHGRRASPLADRSLQASFGSASTARWRGARCASRWSS